MKKQETRSTVLLRHHLKALKLPTMVAECEKVAARCARENVDHLGFLLQLAELELLRREHRAAALYARSWVSRSSKARKSWSRSPSTDGAAPGGRWLRTRWRRRTNRKMPVPSCAQRDRRGDQNRYVTARLTSG